MSENLRHFLLIMMRLRPVIHWGLLQDNTNWDIYSSLWVIFDLPLDLVSGLFFLLLLQGLLPLKGTVLLKPFVDNLKVLHDIGIEIRSISIPC